MAEINLVSNEWKHNLETTPTQSVNSLVSLYDLLFDEEGKFWYSYEDPSTAGTTLDHDIICFNKNILTASMAVDTTLALQNSSWQTFGIDISLPKYDARAKQKIVKYDDTFLISSGSSSVISSEYDIFSAKQYTIYDKDSALPPATLNTFTNNGVLRSQANLGADPSWETYTAPSIGIAGVNTSTDILLSSEDTVFKSTLVTQDGYYAYNRIYLNPTSAYTAMLIARAVGINLSILNMSGNQEYQNAGSSLGSSIISRIFGLPDSSVNNVYSVLDKSSAGLFEYILKNTFVWVRAPFYADYINTSSFQQELNPDSKVVHSEIMLSGAGDFKKYDQYLMSASQTKVTEATADSRSESTQPYIPLTSPTVDFYTSDFLKNNLSSITEINADGNYSSKLKESYTEGKVIEEFLDENVSGNNPVIKGLPIAAINRTDADSEANSGENILPPNYFDPESRMTDKDYRKMGKFPTIMPVDGNIYADGRIISPTIDEIWYMLKKIISGRLSDIVTIGDVTSDANINRAVSLDIGIPYGSGDSYRNDTDTSMTEVPDSEFNFSYEESSTSKYGDPVGFHYASDNNGSIDTLNSDKIVIDKFVNQNNAIVYPVYKSLKSLSDRITVFDKTRTESSNGDRYITNFTAWDSVGESTTTQETENGETVTVQNVIEDNRTVVSGIWAPRKVPYSMRELEALIMGNKYNIISFARFVKENFVVSGKLGKTTSPVDDDYSNVAAGSLYQLHRNYNYEVDNPNTFYNMKGTNTGFDELGNIIGTKAVIDDNDSRTVEEIALGARRYHKDYGTSKAINTNPEYYSSSDVYMAADGTWRYIGDHVRLPILRCDY